MKYQSNCIKLALPKGRFLSPTANLLKEIALDFKGYSAKTRRYRLQDVILNGMKNPHLSAKVFQEKDIPTQVAIGNYDLGICGLDWIEELLVRYPASAVIKIASLNYGGGGVYVVASYQMGISSIEELLAKQDNCHIVSEYPNLAQAFALNLRMRAFKISPVWGAAEVYPPEDASLAILWAKNENEIETQGLIPIMKLLPITAFLIANRESMENKDLNQILNCFSPKLVAMQRVNPTIIASRGRSNSITFHPLEEAKRVKLALPDGHQQPPTAQFLKRAGLKLEGYTNEMLNRRPSTDLAWLGIKVIRPQDMPLQVANGNFDLAITGKDWLSEHLYRFPSSPAMELLNLGFGKVKIVAAVNKDMPVSNINDLSSFTQGGKLAPLRVASEYTNIADKYLRDNYINPYKLIPTWGASEAFLPEDADLLIDNVQTGKTMAQHNLKVIDVLFESTACLIGNKDSLTSPDKKEKIDFLIQTLRRRPS